MLREIRKRKAVSFLVTNGQNPAMIKKLEKKNALPTQLTISVNAPNKELFLVWHKSLRKDAWERFNKTLKIIKELKGKTRRVIRLTLVRKSEKGNNKEISNMEKEHISQYAELIKKAEPDFIHVKGFMSVGFARERMDYDKMPMWEEVIEFAKKIQKELKEQGHKILGKHEYSRAIVLGKNKKELKIKENQI